MSDYLLAAERQAESFGVTIQTVYPPNGLWGCYLHEARTILMRPKLGAMQRDWVLWHELGHAAHGHVGTTPRQEREANEWAVANMLDPASINSSVLPGMTIQEAAATLGVYPAAIRELRAMRSRIGPIDMYTS